MVVTGWKGVFSFSIGALLTISTGALVAITVNYELGDGIAVSIGAKSLGDNLAVSIVSFVISCYSSSVVSTEKLQNWRLQLNQQLQLFGESKH